MLEAFDDLRLRVAAGAGSSRSTSSRWGVLETAPTGDMRRYAKIQAARSSGSPTWYFRAPPFDLPERIITADPPRYCAEDTSSFPPAAARRLPTTCGIGASTPATSWRRRLPRTAPRRCSLDPTQMLDDVSATLATRPGWPITRSQLVAGAFTRSLATRSSPRRRTGIAWVNADGDARRCRLSRSGRAGSERGRRCHAEGAATRAGTPPDRRGRAGTGVDGGGCQTGP